MRRVNDLILLRLGPLDIYIGRQYNMKEYN